jgi:hypothetical protein
MAQISLSKAAAIRGIPRQTLEEWAEKGLLTLYAVRGPALSQNSQSSEPEEKVVDEDEVDRIVESVGWLNLSGQDWEDTQEG